MADSRPKKLHTAGEVLDALGGGSAAARLVQSSPQSMTNARASNRLPYSSFLIFSGELARRGLQARPELWGIKPNRKQR